MMMERHSAERNMRVARPIAFFLAGCLGAIPAAAKTPADTFVVAANMGQMITLDPAAINESFAVGWVRNACDALIAVDPEDPSKLVPGVAESWTVSPDGSKY